MVLKLYIESSTFSQPARAVRSLLYETQTPFEQIEVNFSKGEHKQPAYLAVNPNGVVPTLVDDGFVLWESGTILRYICNSRKLPDHWYPKDAKARALVDRYLDWHHLGLRVANQKYQYNAIVAAAFSIPIPNKEENIKTYLAQLNVSLDFIERVFLANTQFLAGNSVSIADLQAGCELHAGLLGLVDVSKYPKVKAWLNRLAETVPGFRKANANVTGLYAKLFPDNINKEIFEKQLFA